MNKVFISSVIRGYEKEREAAKQAVETLNQYPVMAEGFGARPTSPRVACLEDVRDSDFYVGVFGRRYSGPTEEEFEEAKAQGKDILVFVEDIAREDEQEEFIQKAGEFVTGYHRATFSRPEQLRDAIIKALSRLITLPEPDYEASDAELGPIEELVRRQARMDHDSWLWLALVPSPPRQLVSATDFSDKKLEDTLVEPAFNREIQLFDRRFGTDSTRQSGWLESHQLDAKKHGSPSVRSLMVNRGLCLLFGRTISEESPGFTDHFRSYFIDPRKVAQTVERFLTFATRFYDQAEPKHEITAFSMSAYVAGTDKHFEVPPEGRIQSMNMPWGMSSKEDLIQVLPLHLKRAGLKDGNLGEEIRALFAEKFAER